MEPWAAHKQEGHAEPGLLRPLVGSLCTVPVEPAFSRPRQVSALDPPDQPIWNVYQCLMEQKNQLAEPRQIPNLEKPCYVVLGQFVT